MTAPSHSSGDMMADKRAGYAAMLAGEGDFAAAADMMTQALQLTPDWPVGWYRLADYAEHSGQTQKAIDALARTLLLEPDDMLGAGMKMSLLGQGAQPHLPPSAYVEGLFDDYADRFDNALVEQLDYTVPAKLAQFARSHAGLDHKFGTVVDLGCGTGLFGAEIAPHAEHIEGFDISNNMLAKARKKGFYHLLGRADLSLPPLQSGLFDGQGGARADLVSAADVLIYLGDVKAAIANAAALIKPDGFLAFSVESSEVSAGFELKASLRYAHSIAYITDVLSENGLGVVGREQTKFRMDAGGPITGSLMLARFKARM